MRYFHGIRPAGFVMSFIAAGALVLLSGTPVRAAASDRGRVFRQSNGTWSLVRVLPSLSPKTLPVRGSAGAQPVPESPQFSSWTFAPNVRPHPETTGQHLWPDIAARPDGTVGVAWMDDHIGGNFHIFYSVSADGGTTWSSPEQVDDNTTGPYSKFVSIAFAPSGFPVAVWEDDRTGSVNLYFSKRDPIHGWTPSIRINTAGGPPYESDYMNGSIAVLDDLRFFVAWTDWREGVYNQVYMRGTRDGGATWGTETRISDEIGYEPVAADPCLIVDPSSGGVPGTEVVYCVMDDWRGNAPGGRYPNVYYSRSANGGATWSHGVEVNDITDAFQQVSSHALVHLDNGRLTAGWLNLDTGAAEFRASVSTDQGVTWGASTRINDPAPGGVGTWSSITSSGNIVMAGYEAYFTDWNSYFRPSYDGGLTWTDPVVRMDDDTTGAAAQNTVLAAVSATQVCGAWQDTRPGLGTWLIYTAKGTQSISGVEPSGPNGGADAGAADAWTRLSCTPNPSATGASVVLRLGAASGRPGQALTLFDASGRRLRSLQLADGQATWDGTDASGQPVPPGIYWARIAGARLTARLVRVR